MSTTPLALGTRVCVRRDPEYGPGPWPDEPIGSIVASPLDGMSFRWVDTVRGPEIQYWVLFDQPQMDADGDGPYTSGEVLAKYVEPLANPNA